MNALKPLGLYERVDDELRLPSWMDDDIDLYVAIDASTATISFSACNEFLLRTLSP